MTGYDHYNCVLTYECVWSNLVFFIPMDVKDSKKIIWNLKKNEWLNTQNR